MVHHLLSIIAPLEATFATSSEQSTSSADRGPAGADTGGLTEWFKRLPMVHFASIQAFSGDARDREGCFQPCLVFESCVDGQVAAYLDALVATGDDLLEQVFSRCGDFNPGDRERKVYLRSYLQEHLQIPQLYHIGNPALRVDHIEAGRRLRDALDCELDRLVSHGRSLDPPRAIVDELRLRASVPPSSKLHWHAEIEPGQPLPGAWYADPVSVLTSRLLNWSRWLLLIGVPLAGLAWAWRSAGWRGLAIAIFGAAAVRWPLQRWLRGRNREPIIVDRDAVRALKALEDHGVQNHMASLIMLKDGAARKVAIRLVLRLLNIVYRTWYTDVTPGRLQGLPSIHFAHWSIVRIVDRNGRRREGLLFLSHYDGSWETYLDDFLAHVFSGVVAIWANTVGFRWPLDGPTFKRWARGSMSPWQFWYRAYPDLTVLNIHNNNQIRTGLLRVPGTDAEARLWLARFGSIKQGNEIIEPPLGGLETHDIQGIVLSGYRRLSRAAYVLLKVEQPQAARRWLATLAPRVTDARDRDRGELEQQQLAYNLAFTWSGLKSLGLADSALDAFSDSFQEGLAPGPDSHRSRALGDEGGNAPDRWAWGSGDHRADILLMIFADSEVTLAAEVRAQVGAFTSRQAGTKVTEITGRLFATNEDDPGAKPGREHFGFVDGISQPEIEGARGSRSRVVEESHDLQKPGEFLLGYAANDGTVTPGIPVQAVLDPQRLLPGAPDAPGIRDFGRNGTYLVFRQLVQDVAAFRRSTARAAGAADWSNGSAAAEHVAARMIGRWRDGTPLSQRGSGSSHASMSAPDANRFGFAHDPHGFGCPIGSHIRRVNPRDSLLPDSTVALNSANRHRLLRRGRPYGPPLPEGATSDDGAERGMAFICLNADIERQFEFVQQNWVNNPAFGGLSSERDPVIGTVHEAGGCLTIQADGVRQRLNGFGQFVTVKGGDYFFLPGMSALRYLSSLDGPLRLPAGQLAARPLVPAPAPRIPSVLWRALTRAARTLSALRVIWGVRFPVLLAAALVGLPLVPRSVPTAASDLLITDWVGVAVVAFLASLAGFVVMITLRLVLMYGWRSTPGRARWLTPARWWQVLAFQAIALPVTAASIHYSALDLANADPERVGYWSTVGGLLPAAAAGVAAALALLMLVTLLQALGPDSGAGLFFPPTSLLGRVSRSAWRPRFLWALSSRFSRVSQWIVDSVPEEIGSGYIDYRRRRILPGHAFAISLSAVFVALYALAAVALSPARCAPLDWLPQVASDLMCGVSGRVPVAAYVLALMIAAGWLLAGLSFFLDRYRVSTVLVLGVCLAAVARLAGVWNGGDMLQQIPLVQKFFGQ